SLERTSHILLNIFQEPRQLSNGYYYPGLQEVKKNITCTVHISFYSFGHTHFVSKPIPAIRELYLDLVNEIARELQFIRERSDKLKADHYIEVKEQRTVTTSDG